VLKNCLILFLCSLMVLTVSCATTANYEKILDTWLGSSVDNLIASWGPPQGSYTLSNGESVIEYIRQGSLPIGGYTYTVPQTTYHSGNVSAYGSRGSYAYGNYFGTSTTYVQKQTPVYNISLVCRTSFWIDGNGFIKRWQWQGNHCKALPPK
jgi:hypothetical protein